MYVVSLQYTLLYPAQAHYEDVNVLKVNASHMTEGKKGLTRWVEYFYQASLLNKNWGMLLRPHQGEKAARPAANCEKNGTVAALYANHQFTF